MGPVVGVRLVPRLMIVVCRPIYLKVDSGLLGSLVGFHLIVSLSRLRVGLLDPIVVSTV